MSVQIGTRLPDDLVAFLDDLVDRDSSTSRAKIVRRALERERRRVLAERDALILAAHADADMDDLAAYAASLPLDLG